MSALGEKSFGTVFSSPLGWLALVGRGEKLLWLSFGHRWRRAAVAKLQAFAPTVRIQPARSLENWNHALVPRVQAYAGGEPDDFTDIEIEASDLSQFQQRVLRLCRRIPPGETITYAELAARAGSPAAARAVGNAMAQNRIPLVVPCHRVVGSGGSLGGYSAPGGLATKRRLLAMEQDAAALALPVPAH